MAPAALKLRCALVVPALDEEACIEEVVDGFRTVVRPDGQPWLEEVVVANNGSRDRTADLAQAAGATVVSEPQRGYGRACLAALAYLEERPPGPPDVVVFADGDGAQAPEDLRLLLAPLVRDEADLVIGSRVRRGEPGGLTAPQRFGNAFATLLLRVLHGQMASDLGPFRAVRWTALKSLLMAEPTYGWTIEMQVKAVHRGLRTVEVDVQNRPRIGGQSKVSGTLRGVWGAGTKILDVVLRAR